MLGSSAKCDWRLPHCVLPVPVVAVNQLVAMDPVEGENHHHDEVGNQQRGIKSVPVIQVLEGACRRNASGNNAAARAAEKHSQQASRRELLNVSAIASRALPPL